MTTGDLVFISYAREDRSWAERLYMDLRIQEVNAWLDVRCLPVGSNWKLEVKKAIRQARFFVLLISRHSVNKRGFVQREIKEAIDVLRDFPTGSTFLIPARLDATEPIDDELRELNWVELNPSYHDGLARILSSVGASRSAPLIISEASGSAAFPATVLHKGKEIVVQLPLTLGQRAAINYAPFRTKKEFLQQFFDRLPKDKLIADHSLSYYITYDTRHPGVTLSADLRATYPEQITIVLQYVFSNLDIREEGVSVALKFDGIEQTIGIPYEAIREINIPEIGIAISLGSAS
jgi:hypothetical protein